MSIENLNRLTELEFYAGDLQTANQFEELYEVLLSECQISGDKRTAKVLQGILLRQAQFLLNEWLAEKRAAGPVQLNYGNLN